MNLLDSECRPWLTQTSLLESHDQAKFISGAMVRSSILYDLNRDYSIYLNLTPLYNERKLRNYKVTAVR